MFISLATWTEEGIRNIKDSPRSLSEYPSGTGFRIMAKRANDESHRQAKVYNE